MPSSTSDHNHELSYPSLGNTNWNGTMVTLFQNISDYLDAIGVTNITTIDDSYGNEVMTFSSQQTAVNYVDVLNRITGYGPIIAAAGDDTNIDLNIHAKGSGQVTIGHNLDVNGKSIVSSAGGNIAITPDTSGSIILDGISWPQADGTTGQLLQTDGAGNLSWGTGGALANVVEDTTPQLGGNLDVNGNSIVSVSAGNITLTPDTSGNVVIDGHTWPNSFGTSGYVLTTDASGNLSWQTKLGSGMADLVDDLTPQLGGNLDVNGKKIVDTNGNELIEFVQTTGATTHIQVFNDTGKAGLNIAGGAANLYMRAGATGLGGGLRVEDASGNLLGGIYGKTSETPANYIYTQARSTTYDPRLVCAGSKSDAGLEILVDAQAALTMVSNGGTYTNFKVQSTSNTPANYVKISDAAAASGPTIEATGSDATVDLNINPKSSGNIVLDGLTWPNVDGTTGQVLSTNGAGTLSWTANGGDLINDISPQLGASLDANSYFIEFDNATGIKDDAGNEQLIFNKTASAVNYVDITNAATGNGVTLAANGSDATVDLNINPKSSGNIVLDGLTWPNVDGTTGQVLSTNGAGTLSWTTSSGTKSNKEIVFGAGSFESNESAPASLEFLNGTTVDTMVRAFDDTAQEYVNGKFNVPGDIDTSGTVTFRAYVMAKTAAASKNIALTFEHKAINDDEAFDAAYTSEASGDKAISATQGNVTEVTWTETVTNLGWAANDLVMFRLSRPDASANDLTGDMYLFTFAVEVPRA